MEKKSSLKELLRPSSIKEMIRHASFKGDLSNHNIVGTFYLVLFCYGAQRVSSRAGDLDYYCFSGENHEDTAQCISAWVSVLCYLLYFACCFYGAVYCFARRTVYFKPILFSMTVYGISRTSAISADASDYCHNDSGGATCIGYGFGALSYGIAAVFALCAYIFYETPGADGKPRYNFSMGFFFYFLACVTLSIFCQDIGSTVDYCDKYANDVGDDQSLDMTYCYSFVFAGYFYGLAFLVGMMWGSLLIIRNWPYRNRDDSWRAFYWFFSFYIAAFASEMAGNVAVYCTIYDREINHINNFAADCDGAIVATAFTFLDGVVAIVAMFVAGRHVKRMNVFFVFLLLGLSYLGYAGMAAGYAASECHAASSTNQVNDRYIIYCRTNTAQAVFYAMAGVCALCGCAVGLAQRKAILAGTLRDDLLDI